MATTTTLLRGILGALEAALGPDRPGGALADVFARYDGEPADAIDEHVAQLRGETGASVLVGFLSDDVDERDEAGRPLSALLRPSVLVVRRRGTRLEEGPDGVKGATRDAELLDALYDAAASALDGHGLSFLRGRALAGEVRDWMGRALVVEGSRTFPPRAGSGAVA